MQGTRIKYIPVQKTILGWGNVICKFIPIEPPNVTMTTISHITGGIQILELPISRLTGGEGGGQLALGPDLTGTPT